MLFQIDAPYFCAGGEIIQDCVSEVAPIIKYMKSWTLNKIQTYCQQKNWKFITIYHQPPQNSLKDILGD